MFCGFGSRLFCSRFRRSSDRLTENSSRPHSLTWSTRQGFKGTTKKFFFYFFENSKTKSKAEGVIIPGDPERKHMEKCDQLGGIPYHGNVVDHINSVAKKYAVKTLSFS